MSAPKPPRDDFDPEQQFDEPELSGRHRQGRRMKRLLLDLLSRWHWIVLGLVCGVLGAFYYLSKAPKTYTAVSTLLVKQQTSSVLNTRDQMEDIDMRSVEAMNTIAERLKRLDLLERVASRQDLRQIPGLAGRQVDWLPAWMRPRAERDQNVSGAAAAPPPDPPTLAAMISGWMKVSIRRYTRLLDISIEHQVPEVAKAVADAIAREYIAELAGSRSEGRSSAMDILMRESEDARNRLEEAQTALAAYQRALDFHKQLEAKEAEARDLQRRYLPKHPRMVAASAQLATLQARFIDEFEIARTSSTDKPYWDANSASLAVLADKPDERVTAARRLLLARTGVLESEINSQTTVFNVMLTRIQEADINAEAPEAEIEISNLALPPGLPTSPQPGGVISKGTMAGLAAGLVFAFLLVKLDNKFHTVAQVEGESSLPVLAAIAELKPGMIAAAERGQRSRKSIAADPPPWQAGWDRRIVFRHGLASTSFAEMFRVLRAAISLLGDERQRRITLFTSAIPNEGKTFISANLALAAAGQGRRVLAIDLDLRRPSLHQSFGLAMNHHTHGITEALAGKVSLREAAFPLPGIDNLHLALAGVRAPNPGELLNGQQLARLLDEARGNYDHIVVDSSPLLAVPDTRVIAPFVDNLCLVVRSDYAPRGAVERALDLLDSAETPPVGIVFNGFREKRRLIGFNYSYGYYKYGRYGQAYRYGYGSYGTYGEDESK